MTTATPTIDEWAGSVPPMVEALMNSTIATRAKTDVIKRGAERALRHRYRVTRRLYGILVGIDREHARVLFETQTGPVEYDLPFMPFKNAGVTKVHQPFEYSEVEITKARGEIEVVPEILALAPASSVIVESVPLSPEYQEKRRNVLKYFSRKT